ncbi:hypothetical protein Lfu02_14220 [Longispora fulva]|uniref:SseB protein N-terminal domain-containing protein n=1 Tax=Longispora fulva TaxID=619741 RepID=A0A8J7GH26_9ACTN|nr:SseB family protein [Longispora fulva]MBG6140568.1 hypothetical protein [Longispora fulva]GIG57050.1 hypothetical protein Lfu02_14220 [Longispora fulva]
MDAASWEPANDVEHALRRVLLDGDQRAYLDILGTAPLYVPTEASAYQEGRAALFVWDIDGMRFAPVFTSPDALELAVAEHGQSADAYHVVTYPQLVEIWPDPTLRLAIDPNLPIGAFLNIDDIATGADLLTAAELGVAFTPSNPVEELLAEAAAAGDSSGFLDALVASVVLLPISRPLSGVEDIESPGFPWRDLPGAAEPTIAVFTSPERLAEAWPDVPPSAPVPVVRLADAWPDARYRLVVNPGSVLEATFAGDELRGLVDWGQDMLSRYDESRASVPRAVERAAPPLVMLQKVLAHGEADHYVRGGRHTVTGFVYPYDPVGRATPAGLYAALDLGPDDGFDPADPEVHLLRWPAHRPELYRLAVGGPDEATRAANDGWMIEPAPFRGGGATSAGVPQLKADSVAVPHDAVLVRLGADGEERLVASYDADHGAWVPVATVDLRSALVGP